MDTAVRRLNVTYSTKLLLQAERRWFSVTRVLQRDQFPSSSSDDKGEPSEKGSKSDYFNQLKLSLKDVPQRRPSVRLAKKGIEHKMLVAYPYLHDGEFVHLERPGSSSIVNIYSSDGVTCVGSGVFVSNNSKPASTIDNELTAGSHDAQIGATKTAKTNTREKGIDYRSSGGYVKIYSAEKIALDEQFFTSALNKCLKRRAAERITRYNFYRLCSGDADGFPDMVIDRYGADLVVVSVTESYHKGGTELILKNLLKAVDICLQPKTIVLRTQGKVDSSNRDENENEPAKRTDRVEIVKGNAHLENDPNTPRNRVSLTEIYENGIIYLAPILKGSRWYYELRKLREIVSTDLRPKSILDLYSNAGGFGLLCAARYGEASFVATEFSSSESDFSQGFSGSQDFPPAGRGSSRSLHKKSEFEVAVCVDTSPNVHLTSLAAELNNCGSVFPIQRDVVEFMEAVILEKDLKRDPFADDYHSEEDDRQSSDGIKCSIPDFAKRMYECVVLDPPNLGSDKTALVSQVEASYSKLAALAYRLSTKYIVITCTASQMDLEKFRNSVVRGLETGRKNTIDNSKASKPLTKGLGRIIYQGYAQDQDFPQSVSLPYSSFLKAIIVAFD